MTIRLLVGVIGGVIAALTLLFLMQLLVSGGGRAADSPLRGAPLDMVRIPADPEQVERQRRSLPEPPPPQEAQPTVTVPLPTVRGVAPAPLSLAPPSMELPAGAAGQPSLGAPGVADTPTDGDLMPLVQVPPLYPRDAQLRGTQGWVKIRFTIDEDGSVSAARVVAAEPRRVFDREALRAIARWKFAPRIVDGQAVAREAEQVIEFRLDAD